MSRIISYNTHTRPIDPFVISIALGARNIGGVEFWAFSVDSIIATDSLAAIVNLTMGNAFRVVDDEVQPVYSVYFNDDTGEPEIDGQPSEDRSVIWISKTALKDRAGVQA